MANVNGTDINLTPTEGMKSEAERYRKWKADGEAGGTEVAARRATQILSGDELSPDVVVEMSAWFARHQVDKKGQGFSPDEDGYPSKGRVAWAAWGGDAGQSWSSEKSVSIKKARERSMTDEQRAEPGDLKVCDFVSWNSSGGRARGRIDRVVRDGTIDVPDSSFTITGTEDDPAALITLYRDGEATDRKVGHKFSTLTKIAAIRMFDEASLKRAHYTEFKEEDEDRTLEFPFASEEPVDRVYGMEVLSMTSEAMDMSRLNDGAPLLFNHDPD